MQSEQRLSAAFEAWGHRQDLTRLVFPLLSFAIAQAIEHGVTPVVVLVTIAAAFAAYERRAHSDRSPY